MSDGKMDKTLVAYLCCEDVAAEMDFLKAALGFRPVLRYPATEMPITHAEMTGPDGQPLMLGHPGADFRNPASTGENPQLFLVLPVDDCDAAFARATEAGAVAKAQPVDKPYGHRSARIADPEGYQWELMQPLAEVPPADWGAATYD